MKIYTPEQAAEVLAVNRETVYKLLRSGKLKASRIGKLWRISEADLEQFMNETRTEGGKSNE